MTRHHFVTRHHVVTPPDSGTRPRLAITLGDPRGIGPEVVGRALESTFEADFTLIGPDELIEALPVDQVEGTGHWGQGVGTTDEETRARAAGQHAGRAIERAAAAALAGRVDAIVTAPASKYALHLAGYDFPGHTELLAHLAGDVDVAMMLVGPTLRVVLVTTHLPLRDVPAAVTEDAVVRAGEITCHALRQWFDVETPRIAVCALNPHAGEHGRLGHEDDAVIRPAVERLAMDFEFDLLVAAARDLRRTVRRTHERSQLDERVGDVLNAQRISSSLIGIDLLVGVEPVVGEFEVQSS